MARKTTRKRKSSGTRRKTTAKRRTTTKRRRNTGKARTRRRSGSPSTRKRSTRRRSSSRKTTRKRRRNPGGNYTYRSPNPTTFSGLKKALFGALKIGVLVAGVLAGANWLADYETEVENKNGQKVKVPLSRRVGPLFQPLAAAGALFVIPKFILTGSLAKHRSFAVPALQTLFAITLINLVAYAARRGWSLSEDDVIAEGHDDYPKWTDFLAIREPKAKISKENAGVSGGGGGGMGHRRTTGVVEVVLDPQTGAYVAAA